MKNVFITGVSGYFGSKLVALFDKMDEVETITGIDIHVPRITSPKLEFVKHDVRDDMYPALATRNIDWAIHTAFILPPLHDRGFMEDININGTRNFLHSCVNAGVKQAAVVTIFLCGSLPGSVSAYGLRGSAAPVRRIA